MPETTDNAFIGISSSFRGNLLRAISVASLNAYDEPTKMTQQNLAEKSKVTRATIAKYVSSGKADAEATTNPDLKTICRLAQALNVPPALLLFRTSDWSQLGQAIEFLMMAVANEKFQTIAKEIVTMPNKRSTAMAQQGLATAQKFGIYKPSKENFNQGENYKNDLQNLNTKIRQGIFATTALPSAGELTNTLTPILVSICAVMGAHISPSI